MKKLFAMFVAQVLLLSGLTGCTPETSQIVAPQPEGEKTSTSKPADTPSKEGKTLVIYCWNEEFQSRFNDYYASKLPEGIEVKWVITPNQNNQYQNKLDEDLLKQDSVAQDERIDMFLVEADYALKYVNTDYTLDVRKDIGLSDEDLGQQYTYTQEITTDGSGALKGVSWQATPGLFAYRRSIARDVVGTDDPIAVQTALSDWTKFDQVAEKAAAKGYKMLSGFDDSYRTFSNNVEKPWVDENNVINIDDNLMKWVDQTKAYTDKGYNNKTSLWNDGWAKDQGPSGKVFGFFYSTWGINYTLLGNSLETPVAEGGKEEVGNGIFGDYAVCEGPQPYYWGGSWICAAKGTDNTELIKDIMRTLTCDSETMKQITLDTQDYTNNQKAMEEIGSSDFQSAFLGGQNHIKLFASTAKNISMDNISPYDQGLNESFQQAFMDYFNGNVTKEQALDNFYKAALIKYPELKMPQ